MTWCLTQIEMANLLPLELCTVRCFIWISFGYGISGISRYIGSSSETLGNKSPGLHLQITGTFGNRNRRILGYSKLSATRVSLIRNLPDHDLDDVAVDRLHRTV